MKKNRFIKNASITSVTSLFVNIIGISFNVFISNKIGAAGVGMFQLVMSVYGFAVTLATSGINLAATRIITDEITLNKKGTSDYIMKRCLIYSFIFGFLSFVLLFIFDDYIAFNLLGDVRTKSSLKALSISMPFISMSSAINGYFMAKRRIHKSALAQVFEQFIKIFAVLLSVDIFLKKGIEYSCLCIVLSGSVSEIISFLYLYILYKTDEKDHRFKNKKEKTYSAIFKISLPVAFSAYIRSALVTIQHILIPKGLKMYGYDSEKSLKCYGVIHGMALSVMLFPSAILKSLSGLLVPELSECNKLGHKRQANHIISKIIKLTLIFSIYISGIFFSFANDIGTIIYKNSEVGMYIRILSPLIVIIYVDNVVDGMLKGLNQQLHSMWYNIIDSAISIIAVLYLIPEYGTNGYISVIYISELLNAFLSVNRLIKITDFNIRIISWIFIPSVVIYAIGFFIEEIFKNVDTISLNILIIKLILTTILYLAMLMIQNYKKYE